MALGILGSLKSPTALCHRRERWSRGQWYSQLCQVSLCWLNFSRLSQFPYSLTWWAQNRQNVILWVKPDSPVCTCITQERKCTVELVLPELMLCTRSLSWSASEGSPQFRFRSWIKATPHCFSRYGRRLDSLDYRGHIFQLQVPRQPTENQNLWGLRPGNPHFKWAPQQHCRMAGPDKKAEMACLPNDSLNRVVVPKLHCKLESLEIFLKYRRLAPIPRH